MKLSKYKQFINALMPQSKKDIDSICIEYRIKNYTINPDESIDVDGNVDLSSKSLTKLPLKFRNVNGYFYCQVNQLTTLEGSPDSVGGDFACSDNKLTTLEGCPESVGGDFSCSNNQLTSLEGGPKSVGGYFDCSYNQLTTLKGGPSSVGVYFSFFNNQLTNFYGFPEDWEGDVNFTNNPCKEILYLFPEEKWCQSIDLLNEFEVIRGNKIFLDGLEEVYRQLKVEMPENLELENYEIR
jgi:hypothetical protein